MTAVSVDDIFKCVFMNENFFISIRISLKFGPKCLIYCKSALIQVMAWRQAITWTNADPVHWRIYAALGGHKLKILMKYHIDILTSHYQNH